MRALILYADYSVRASYYDDWIDAFRTSSDFQITEQNICELGAVRKVRKRLPSVDIVILLHSVNADHVFYLEPLAPVLSDRRCLLLSFIGNEVSLPGAYISDKRRVLEKINPDIIATQLLLEGGEYLWGDIGRSRVVSIPHALNPNAFYPTIDQGDRTIDIGVRSFRYPPHLGDDDRNRLMDYFQVCGPQRGLVVDIAEERLDRKQWAAYLNSTKGTLATEAGSWYLSRNDCLVKEIMSHVGTRYSRRFSISSDHVFMRKLVHRLPWTVRNSLISMLRRGPFRYDALQDPDIDIADIVHDLAAKRERPSAYGKCISSRHFDAVGTGTAQILMEGRYNDILVPGEHYLSLKQDFSNIEEVLGLFRDPVVRQRMVTSAREEVLSKHTYKHRVADLKRMIA